jgi:ceramide glucosyltransferase
MALTRQTLERLGGLESLKDTLADDYALGQAVRGLGSKVAICREIVGTVVHEPDAATLLRHELRWVRTMKVIAPADMAASAVTHPVALALLAAGFSGGTGWAFAILALATCCRGAMVAACDRALRLSMTPPWLVLLRDVLSFGLLIAGFCGSRVAWRDRNFRVDRKGRLVMDGDPLA